MGFVVVSLSLGNPGFPLGDGLLGDKDLLTQSLLGHVFAFALSLDNMANAVHEDASLSIAMAQLFHNSAKMSRK